MPLAKGDFVLVEYTVKIKDTNTVIDTTDAELAKKENIFESGKVYGPTLVVLGKSWVNPFVEDEITQMNENEEREIEVPPDKAFGERDPNKVRVFSLREFQRRGYSVKIGDAVEIGGSRGIVKQISGGRVVVDFNHPLAGKVLTYKVKVLRKLEDALEKLKNLAVRHLRIPGEELGVSYEESEKKLTITLPSKYISHENINYAKLALAADVFDLFKDSVSVLVFQEVIKRP
ncbi:MAG: FKBP-type peptidyl-prolyl cis-trans isomerase [Desulfurococcaceae archaeon]